MQDKEKEKKLYYLGLTKSVNCVDLDHRDTYLLQRKQRFRTTQVSNCPLQLWSFQLWFRFKRFSLPSSTVHLLFITAILSYTPCNSIQPRQGERQGHNHPASYITVDNRHMMVHSEGVNWWSLGLCPHLQLYDPICPIRCISLHLKQERVGYQELFSSFSSEDSGSMSYQDDFLMFSKISLSYLACFLLTQEKNNTDSLPKGNIVHMKNKCFLQVSAWHCIVPNSPDRLARIIVSAVKTRFVITRK